MAGRAREASTSSKPVSSPKRKAAELSVSTDPVWDGFLEGFAAHSPARARRNSSEKQPPLETPEAQFSEDEEEPEKKRPVKFGPQNSKENHKYGGDDGFDYSGTVEAAIDQSVCKLHGRLRPGRERAVVLFLVARDLDGHPQTRVEPDFIIIPYAVFGRYMLRVHDTDAGSGLLSYALAQRLFVLLK